MHKSYSNSVSKWLWEARYERLRVIENKWLCADSKQIQKRHEDAIDRLGQECQVLGISMILEQMSLSKHVIWSLLFVVGTDVYDTLSKIHQGPETSLISAHISDNELQLPALDKSLYPSFILSKMKICKLRF